MRRRQNILAIGSTSSGETRLTYTAMRTSDEQEAGTIYSSGEELSDIDTISQDSSYGPTTDGRIKPEVLAPGDMVSATLASPREKRSRCCLVLLARGRAGLAESDEREVKT